jgi:mannose-1-phosphate guanylyltransferase
MIVDTVARVRELVGGDRVLIITGEHLMDATREALPDLPAEAFLAEPAARNTAPAIGLAAVVAQERWDDEVMAVLPSDHWIADPEGFRQRLREAEEAARHGYIVTLGITPSHPETGYGYVRYDADDHVTEHAMRVEAFVEKPNGDTAAQYLAAGNYAWNAGIFVFQPSVMLDEIERQLPEMRAGLESIGRAFGQGDFQRTLQEVFPTLKKISIDYGVMEDARRVAVVPADVGWTDVGHWAALDAVLESDENGNVTHGNVVVDDAHDSVVFDTTDGVTAVVGVEGLVVVRTPDAVLVVPRDRAQDVRSIVAQLRKRGLDFT